MKRFLAMVVLIFVATFCWRVLERLSSDALSMALGILLGVMASVPAAMMVLAAHRRETYNPPARPQSPRIEQHTHYYLHDTQMPYQWGVSQKKALTTQGETYENIR